MPTYSYRARDSLGKLVKGTMESINKTALIDKLHKMGYMTTSVAESSSSSIFNLSALLERLRPVNSNDMLMFYVQLSNMIGAGVTILVSLSTLAKQAENGRLKSAIGNVSRQVEAGSTIAQAFSSQPRLFPKLFINMIRAGEASGNLDAVLLRYADFYERQEEIREKIKGALFYPIILLCAGIAVSLFIVTFVIPQFADIYIKSGVKLPLPTRIVYTAGMAVKNYWYVMAGGGIAFAALVKFYSITPSGSMVCDRLKLTLPVAGPLYRKVAISRFTRTLSTLLGSGVPILEALNITKEITDNRVLENVITNVRKYVEKGEKMSEPMKVSEEFPPDVVQMVAVGEESGELAVMLGKIADFYDMTVNYAVKKLTTIIEPVFLVIMGIMVGCIMASMLLPIFDMAKTLQH